MLSPFLLDRSENAEPNALSHIGLIPTELVFVISTILLLLKAGGVIRVFFLQIYSVKSNKLENYGLSPINPDLVNL